MRNGGYQNGDPAHPAKPPNYPRAELFLKERLLLPDHPLFIVGITQDLEVVRLAYHAKMVADYTSFARQGWSRSRHQSSGTLWRFPSNPILETAVGRQCWS
jgi:hypothetical protein